MRPRGGDKMGWLLGWVAWEVEATFIGDDATSTSSRLDPGSAARSTAAPRGPDNLGEINAMLHGILDLMERESAPRRQNKTW